MNLNWNHLCILFKFVIYPRNRFVRFVLFSI